VLIPYLHIKWQGLSIVPDSEDNFTTSRKKTNPEKERRAHRGFGIRFDHDRTLSLESLKDLG
jgi:hypothetical protein